MGPIASQITSLTIVNSIVYSGADQRKHQSSASLAFVWGIHRDRWIPRTKGQLRGKCFHLMTSSWFAVVSRLLGMLQIHGSSKMPNTLVPPASLQLCNNCARGHHLLCFVGVLLWAIYMIYIRIASLALGQINECQSASEATLNNADIQISQICWEPMILQ